MRDPKEMVRRGYDAIAERFGRWSAELPEPTLRHLERLAANVPRPARVLDLGCGAGDKTLALGEGLRRVGVDVSSAQLAMARRMDATIALVQGDLARPLFRPAVFDAAVALFSIIHVPREEHAPLLAELASWLRPGAPFVATLGATDDPAGVEEDWLGAPMYWSGFDAQTNVRLVHDAGFEIESSEIGNAIEDGEPVPFLCIFARRN